MHALAPCSRVQTQDGNQDGNQPLDGEEVVDAASEDELAHFGEPRTAPAAAAPRTQSRIARRQDACVAALGPAGQRRLAGSVFVVHKNERAIYFASCAHALVDMLLAAGIDPFELGVDIGLGGDPIRWLTSTRAQIRFISLPPASYFQQQRLVDASVTRESVLARIRSLGCIAVDGQDLDIAILELPLSGKNGEVLVVDDDIRHLRALPFANEAPVGYAVFVLGYGQCGGTLSAAHITAGRVAGMPGNGFLRIDAAILSGHSGGPVVIVYKDERGREAYAVVGVAIRSKTGELGDVRSAHGNLESSPRCPKHW